MGLDVREMDLLDFIQCIILIGQMYLKRGGLCPPFINIPIKIHLLFSLSVPDTTDDPNLELVKNWLGDDLRDLQPFILYLQSLTQKTI